MLKLEDTISFGRQDLDSKLSMQIGLLRDISAATSLIPAAIPYSFLKLDRSEINRKMADSDNFEIKYIHV